MVGGSVGLVVGLVGGSVGLVVGLDGGAVVVGGWVGSVGSVAGVSGDGVGISLHKWIHVNNATYKNYHIYLLEFLL